MYVEVVVLVGCVYFNMLLYIVKYSLITENYRRPQVRTLVQGLYFQMLDAGVRCPCMLLGIKAPVLGVEIKASTGGGIYTS